MKSEFSLREKKKAKLRIALLESLLELLKDSDMGQIGVERICAGAETNKVTFFQNFRHKEQLLDYFVTRWSYDRSFEIESDAYSGEKGIRAVFDSVAADPLGLKIMVSLVAYYTRLSSVPEMPEISPCEYSLFNPQAYAAGTRPLPLDAIFRHYLSQIKSISKKKSEETFKLLVATFYGVPVQMFVMQEPASGLPAAYRQVLDRILRNPE
jgi:AcrR family transcriptional regulator